jgi:hypothetical protein
MDYYSDQWRDRADSRLRLVSCFPLSPMDNPSAHSFSSRATWSEAKVAMDRWRGREQSRPEEEKRSLSGGRVGSHGLVSSHDGRKSCDALEVRVYHGVLTEVEIDIARPGQADVQIQVSHTQLPSHHELLVLEIDVVEEGELGVGSLHEVVTHFLRNCGVKEISNNFVVLCTNKTEGLVDQVAINSSSSRQDGMRGILVSDPDQSGSILVQNGSIFKDDSGNISLGIDGVEIHSGCGLVGAEINLFGFNCDTGDFGSNEVGSTTRGGCVIKLWHCEKD